MPKKFTLTSLNPRYPPYRQPYCSFGSRNTRSTTKYAVTSRSTTQIVPFELPRVQMQISIETGLMMCILHNKQQQRFLSDYKYVHVGLQLCCLPLVKQIVQGMASFFLLINLLRYQIFYMFRHMYSKQVFVILTTFGLFSVFLLAALLKLEITASFLRLSLSVHSGSLKRI